MDKSKSKKGLGKGLGALFEGVEREAPAPKAEIPEKSDGDGVQVVKIRDIEPNPDQPRRNFDKEKLAALADSIREHGVIQPILVREKKGGMYEIIAGERRWRASKMAGLKEVPCIIGEYTEKQVMEIALIENLQREDLNPIEEAEGYRKLMDTFGLTQEEVSGRVGKSRSAVANALRLNNLSANLKKLVSSGAISQGHARTLLALPKEEQRAELAERIIKEDLSVRQTENAVNFMLKDKTPAKPKTADKNMENYFKNLSSDLSKKFETKVLVKYGKKCGKIEIEYYTPEDLENILKKIK